MIRTRWCWAMNSRESCCRPGSGRVVDLEATNGRVPESHLAAPTRWNGYRLGTERQTRCFTNQFNRAGTLTGKRQRILRGMLQAVGTQGYEQTAVQDAIAHAGLYRQAFYDNFEDKEDCYLQALDAGSGVGRAGDAARRLPASRPGEDSCVVRWPGCCPSSTSSPRSAGPSWSMSTPPASGRLKANSRRWSARRR